jgi:hypothetical protein
MALTNEELQDILDNLTPEEQKQLYNQLGRNISNTEPTTPTQSNKDPISKENSKVYCCIKCGSANYKKMDIPTQVCNDTNVKIVIVHGLK